jgi:hypothetical protein
VNQTEILLQHARNEADRRLIEFGYDPWQVEHFLQLTPLQRLRVADSMVRLVIKGRRAIAAKRG